MTAIIFGANGQDGFYLTQLLQKENCKVIGVSRHGNYLPTDLTDYKAVSKLINNSQPEYIFHFAANSTTQHEALFENHTTISTGTLIILEAVKKESPKTKVFISGTGLQFKNDNRPIKENDAFEARNAYSVSRIQSAYAARYFRTLGIKTYVGYFFNHDSPMRNERHVTKKISEAAKRIAAGSNEKFEIGDINIVKEYAFAGDVVKAIWKLVQQDNITEAVIGTGKGFSIEDWLEECFKLIDKDWRSYVMPMRDFVADYKQLVSDPTTIFSLGWQPEVDFAELATMMIKK